MRPLAALLILAALAGGCGRRERSNPFDPGNPSTRGVPANFAAFAERGAVSLEWAPASNAALLGYLLYRSLDPDTGYVAVSNQLAPGTSSYHDVGLLDGTDHYYRLHYVFDTGMSPRYAADVATPGSVRPWVTDYDAPALDQVTPDGRRVAASIPNAVTYFAGELSVNPATGVVWVCDPYGGNVNRYDPATGLVAPTTRVFSTPVAIAVDAADGGAWVADSDLQEVFHLDDTGAPVPPLLGSMNGPYGLAIDPNDRSLWACERFGSRVRHVAPDGTSIGPGVTFVVAPSRVVVDSANGDAWVSAYSRGTIVRVSKNGARLDSVTTITGPLGMAMDARRGRLWVGDPVAGHVVALRRNGSTEFVVGGLGGAYALAVDLRSGDCWVTAQDLRNVVRISTAGVVTRRLGGFVTPNGIALDPGP